MTQCPGRTDPGAPRAVGWRRLLKRAGFLDASAGLAGAQQEDGRTPSCFRAWHLGPASAQNAPRTRGRQPHSSRSPPGPSPSLPQPGIGQGQHLAELSPSQGGRTLPSAGPCTSQPAQSSLHWAQDIHLKPYLVVVKPTFLLRPLCAEHFIDTIVFSGARGIY